MADDAPDRIAAGWLHDAAPEALALVAPELRAALGVLPRLDLSDEGLALIRASVGTGMAAPPLDDAQLAVKREELFVPGAPGDPAVRLLVYTPPTPTTLRPAYLHMHGGGFVLGTPEINDGGNRTLALEHDCIVVSVDYRLAPETRFPGALEDCHAALVWLHGEAASRGVDRSRIAIGGESAGGGHAAALALLARDRAQVDICFQMLDAPMIDDRSGTSEDRGPHAGQFVWTPERNRQGWSALLGCAAGGANVPDGAVPARAVDLSRLPATLITVGALDLFAHENIEYARRLIAAGVPTELYVQPGSYHGAGAAGLQVPQIQAVMALRRSALARAFSTNA